jgi:hypothetical protein
MSLTDRELNLVLAGGGRLPSLLTPQSTIEAIMYSVRERGLIALNEPASRERLATCDPAARSQINTRIAKLTEAGRLPESTANAA